MGKKRKSKPFLGRAVDIGEPGLNYLKEARSIVANIVKDYKEGIIDAKTANRILGRLKRYIRESALDENDKKAALEYVNGAINKIKGKKDTRKKGRRKRRRKKKEEEEAVEEIAMEG